VTLAALNTQIYFFSGNQLKKMEITTVSKKKSLQPSNSSKHILKNHQLLDETVFYLVFLSP